ncbi:MAG: flagellar hook-associated protein FlgK [Lachnospiraceae bacterium]|nr:flagellar hook-associated protein FlgK [Lachnospiraceae bacterium]MDD7177409.1 flagellar hook-associated protein FlgK [bacterium]MDY5516637.1 flagellar hook-associated protein FlgK [Lachnospiraceae bacterium]
MASTFFGLSIATSGLRAYQASANTVANNISNVDTTGYTKQVTNMKANSAIRSYTEYGTLSAGVSAESVTQVRSEYYDNKYWQYSGYRGEYDEKVKYMDQLQTFFQDDSTMKGFASVYAEFFTNIDSLRGNAADTSVRNQVISGAKKLCSYFNTVADGLRGIQEDINEQIKTTVDTINSIAQKIALLNDQINDVEINGSYANDMRDQRALLVDQLSTIVAVDVQETKVVNSNYPDMYTGATHYTLKINGLELVNGSEYRQLECVAREYKDNQNDAEGLYDIRWADTKIDFPATGALSGGSLKALYQLRDGNNHGNFSGKVTSTAGRQVVISDCNIKSELALNLPNEGVLTLGNREYTYSSFMMQKLPSGETTFSFTITSETTGLSSMVGREATVGTSIDFKGIPYYQSQMNEFLRAFTKAFNDIQHKGVDLYKNPMQSFFVAASVQGTELGFAEAGENVIRSNGDSYYRLTASNLKIADACNDPSIFATADLENFENGQDYQGLIEEMQKLQKDVVLYRGSGGDQFLATMISDVTVDTEESTLLSDNYTTIVNMVEKQRTSISGVDEDEEALDLVKFQNAYNLCSKLVQIMSEMYDRLITSTGV